MIYEELNDAVNKVFLDGSHSGLPLYLDLEHDAREQLATRFSEEVDNIEWWIGASVEETLDWGQRNIYHFHKRHHLEWHRDNYDKPPPFTALLLSFSLAAEHMRADEEYAATNYYRRLAEVFGVKGDDYIQKLRMAGPYTVIFWKALNNWLMQNDYAYGLPTARAVIDHWKYVSFALSQSLVRDADRKKFHDMFLHFGLTPGTNLGESEMMLYLNEWMAGYGPSTWLRRLWNSESLRERIAGAAVAELETWETRGENLAISNLKRRLGWILVMKTFPSRRLNLFLGVAGIGEAEISGFKLSDSPSEIARAAFSEVDSVVATPLPGIGMLGLEPISRLKLDALLQASFTLQENERDIRLTHDHSPIVPLIKVEGRPFYREVSRISLHIKHAILTHKNWVGKVEDFLNKHARSGFSNIEGNGRNGLPSQWTLVVDVEVVRLPTTEVNKNLQCLVPLSEGAGIQFIEGLKLDTGIWLAEAPPEVIASDEEGILGIKFSKNQLQAGRQEVLHNEPIDAFRPSFLSNLVDELAGNNYLVKAYRGNTDKAEKQLAFRSAITPRKLISGKDYEVSYSLGSCLDGCQNLGAMPVSEQTNDVVTLRGMLLDGDITSLNVPEGDPDNCSELSISHEQEEEWQVYNLEEIQGAFESCILRGYHYWRCPTSQGPGNTISRVMRCRDCGTIQVAGSNNGRMRRPYYRPISRPHLAHQPDGPGIDQEIAVSVSMDSVLDALCYAGSGRWSKFESILSSLVELPWQVYEVSRNLVDLGFIDVQLTDDGTQNLYWSCSPPCLVITPQGRGYLSGFRNRQLVADVEKALGELGASMSIDRRELAPTCYSWDLQSLTSADALAVLGEVKDPFGRQVKVINSPANAIIAGMPSVSDIKHSLKQIYVDSNTDVERFNPTSGKWSKSVASTPGAYRVAYAGRRYFFRDKSGENYQGEHSIVKILAARLEGICLHGYKKETKEFQCVLGCAPPGLFRRALVSLTGCLPTTGNGKHIYGAIPRGIANAMMKKLYQ